MKTKEFPSAHRFARFKNGGSVNASLVAGADVPCHARCKCGAATVEMSWKTVVSLPLWKLFCVRVFPCMNQFFRSNAHFAFMVFSFAFMVFSFCDAVVFLAHVVACQRLSFRWLRFDAVFTGTSGKLECNAW